MAAVEGAVSGFFMVLLAGTFQGTFLAPMKYMASWEWENSWFGFSSSAYFVFPWILAALTVPHLGRTLSALPPVVVGHTLLFGLGWGLGALLMGIGVDFVGLAIGFAIVLGLAASIGTVIPLLVLTPEKFSGPRAFLIVIGMILMLAGIVFCSCAGKAKEKKESHSQQPCTTASRRSYGVGLVLCILSGVLSSCGNLGFAFGSAITSSAVRSGASEQLAPNLLWAVITVPLFVCNAAYCVYLIVRRGTIRKFLQPGTGSYYWLAALMGALWLAGMVFYGSGANRMGDLGPSIGWSILMSSIVVVANLWGVVTGEWTGSSRKSVKLMIAGLTALVFAIFAIGCSNAS